MRILGLWIMMLCSVVIGNKHFGGTYHLHLQDRIKENRKALTFLSPGGMYMSY
jgi:hypothetical protein